MSFKLSLISATALIVSIGVTAARADVDAVSIRFAGGCHPSGIGGCVIKASATGDSLEGEEFFLQHADSRRGHFKDVSPHARLLDDSGRTTFKFRNNDGCYRISQGNAGTKSNVICEK